jgi:cytochrome c biogenesis protein CcmG, thiol:disulfide interchange protein DsbE
MSDVVSEPEVSVDVPRPRRVAPFIALAVAVAIGALFVVLAGSDSNTDDTVSSFLIGEPAPTSRGTTLDGEPFDLAQRKGSWVVLNFFDPTCVPCVQEHPELVALQAQQAQTFDGAELYTIINRGSDESVRAFFAENGGTWPVVSDPTGSISTAFGVAKIPETWIIDPDGFVRARYANVVTAAGVSSLLQQMREGIVE